ncbi:MAG: DMT family transporter [Anaerolineae bacterium]
MADPHIMGRSKVRAPQGGVLLALFAVIAFSTSPVFVLRAAPLSPFVITFGRLIVATACIVVLGHLARQPFLPARADLPLFIGFGFVTALHFLSYIASLNFTTVAQSLAIVYTAPIFVTLFSAIFLKEPISLRKWLGVIIAVVGIGLLVGFEARMDGRMALGDLLALASAITFGLYSVAGRSQRARYGLFTYAGTVYGAAALWALPAAALTFSTEGVGARSLLALLAAGLIPLGAGHTLYNAALRRAHATVVNLIASQEVTGGVLLAALFLGQMPRTNEIVGAGIALAGIALVLI